MGVLGAVSIQRKWTQAHAQSRHLRRYSSPLTTHNNPNNPNNPLHPLNPSNLLSYALLTCHYRHVIGLVVSLVKLLHAVFEPARRKGHMTFNDMVTNESECGLSGLFGSQGYMPCLNQPDAHYAIALFSFPMAEGPLRIYFFVSFA